MSFFDVVPIPHESGRYYVRSSDPEKAELEPDRAAQYLVETFCGCKGFEVNGWCSHMDKTRLYAKRRIASALAMAHPFKVLSVKQPWAWLLVNGPKDIENRSRKTSFKGLCLISASVEPDPAIDEIRDYCKVEYGVSIPDKLDMGGVVGACVFGPCVDRSNSRWFNGPFGYPVKDRTPLEFTEMKGMLGFFNAPDHVNVKFAHLKYEVGEE